MSKKIQPNMKCRLIGGTEGPNNSPNKGKICITIHQQPLEHIVHGPLWYVQSVGGMDFVSQDGVLCDKITVAEDWLEPIEDDPTPPEVKEAEKELITE